MGKYKVGDELITCCDENEETSKLMEMTNLTIHDEYARLCWGVKVINVEYDKPNVTLTYRNPVGEINKVFAICKDIANFDEEKVLEKALLKAFQNEIINTSVFKNQNIKR